MKTQIRIIGSPDSASSAGGRAAPIIVTVPSAGETTSPSTTGVTRGGSRKK